MKVVIGIFVGLLLMTGAALADEGFDEWGTPYYDLVMDVSFDDTGNQCAMRCAPVARSHCGISGSAVRHHGSAASHGYHSNYDHSSGYSYGLVTRNNDGFGSPWEWIYE